MGGGRKGEGRSRNEVSLILGTKQRHQASPAGPPGSRLYRARPKDFRETPPSSRDCGHTTSDRQPQDKASSSPEKELGLPPLSPLDQGEAA